DLKVIIRRFDAGQNVLNAAFEAFGAIACWYAKADVRRCGLTRRIRRRKAISLVWIRRHGGTSWFVPESLDLWRASIASTTRRVASNPRLRKPGGPAIPKA